MNFENLNKKLGLLKNKLNLNKDNFYGDERFCDEIKIGNNKNDLAAVCCYFNPCHYKSRFKNYKIFRKGIEKTGVKLLTVELAFGNDSFELNNFSDVLQLRTSKENIMWQKERLLNIGIMQLIGKGYEKIAWLDADIVFEDDGWVKDLSKELNRFPVCQVFSEVYRESLKGEGDYKDGSIKYLNEHGVLNRFSARPGFGWAARADVLRRVGLFDLATASTDNDVLIFCGCFYYNQSLINRIKKEKLFSKFNGVFLKNYENWAKKWGSLVKGRVGFINHKIRALYHGEIKNRKYGVINNLYKKYNFNPGKDIKLSDNLCFEWNSDKPKLHKDVKDYFYSRKEDS